jgi:diguanylate cyclase (GGDEF)-like protein
MNRSIFRVGIQALRPLGLAWAMALAAASTHAQSVAGMLDRAEIQSRIDPEASAGLARDALRVLGPDGAIDERARALLILCEHEAERDTASAQARLEAARTLMPRVQRRGLQARLFGCEGELRLQAGDSAAAMRLHEQAVRAAEQAGDEGELAQALFLRGYLRGVRGEFATGLSDLERAATLYDKLGKTAHRTTVHNGIATVYNRMGDAEQARRFYASALREQQAGGLKREQVVTWHNLGRVHEQLRDWPAAEEAFTQTLTLSRAMRYALGEAYALRGLAAVANARGNAVLALERLAQVEALQRPMVDERLRGQMLLQRGVALGQQGQPVESRAALLESLRIFEKAESARERAAVHEALAQLHAGQAQWRDAYLHLNAFKGLSDRLLLRQIDDRFAALKSQVDRTAEAQQMRLLEREQAATQVALEQERTAGRLRNTAIALGTLGALVLAVLAWRLRRSGLAMRQLAHTDELTGLPNRRDVLNRLDRVLGRGVPCALLIVDLDHFKRINDTQGHPAGDAVLRAAAEVLRPVGRAPAALGRLGGEEFVLVLPDAGADMARATGEQLRQGIEAMDVGALVPGGQVTTSVGVTVSLPGDSASDLLRRADRALYLAKARGRNRVEIVLPEDESGESLTSAAMPSDRNPPSSSSPRPSPAA